MMWRSPRKVRFPFRPRRGGTGGARVRAERRRPCKSLTRPPPLRNRRQRGKEKTSLQRTSAQSRLHRSGPASCSAGVPAAVRPPSRRRSPKLRGLTRWRKRRRWRKKVMIP
ncbi:unnamed protein product, partial [Ectocarpus sp. 12 AP-2014]